MDQRQEDAFWETIGIFNAEGLLPYVMIIGSWAEYIYSHHFSTNFLPNLRTRDIDFFYSNIRKPANKIDITKALTNNGYSCTISPMSGITKFLKEDLFEIEFLTRVIGSGTEDIYEIPSIGIRAMGIREINMLSDYPLQLSCRDFLLTVPEPAIYVLQKLFINPTRLPEYKREKDLNAVRMLLVHINQSTRDKKQMNIIFNSLTPKIQNVIKDVCSKNYIDYIN